MYPDINTNQKTETKQNNKTKQTKINPNFMYYPWNIFQFPIYKLPVPEKTMQHKVELYYLLLSSVEDVEVGFFITYDYHSD